MAILDGIRVLELARFIAGPFCTQMLADHGAEVIKIEDPKGGDGIRTSPPFWGETGAEFYAFNRGKKSLSLNLRHEKGQEIFRRLAAGSDVILDVNRPGMMDKLALGYQACQQLNPRIIYCVMTGYGSQGSMAQMGGHDINFMALSGALNLVGPPEGAPIIPPFYLSSMAGAANYAFGAIALALYHREQTGLGQYLEVSMYDSALSCMAHIYASRAGLNRLPQRGAEMLTGAFACYNIYECADGEYISLGAVETKFWQRFCEGIGRTDIIDRQWQLETRETVKQEVAAIIKTRSRQEWVEHFEGQDLCLTPVLNLDEAAASILAQERGLFQSLKAPDPSLPALNTIGPVINAPSHPPVHSRHYPDLGEDSKDILAGLGYNPEEVQNFRANGII